MMEPEDLDAVLERWKAASPADVRTAHMEAPIDREVLARLRRLQGENEPDIVAELAGMFLEDARSRLVAIEEALQKGEAPTVERTAHTLKGGSGSMGARVMLGLCAQLEDIGASGDLSQGSELLGRIKEELGRIEWALETEVSGNRFQVKWFQPVKPSTGSPLRMKTTSPSVISPISVRGISTPLASASSTGLGAQIRSS
jgi:HPt (histidine-containing phosphotransfer) domain-containing protein